MQTVDFNILGRQEVALCCTALGIPWVGSSFEGPFPACWRSSTTQWTWVSGISAGISGLGTGK